MQSPRNSKKLSPYFFISEGKVVSFLIRNLGALNQPDHAFSLDSLIDPQIQPLNEKTHWLEQCQNQMLKAIGITDPDEQALLNTLPLVKYYATHFALKSLRKEKSKLSADQLDDYQIAIQTAFEEAMRPHYNEKLSNQRDLAYGLYLENGDAEFETKKADKAKSAEAKRLFESLKDKNYHYSDEVDKNNLHFDQLKVQIRDGHFQGFINQCLEELIATEDKMDPEITPVYKNLLALATCLNDAGYDSNEPNWHEHRNELIAPLQYALEKFMSTSVAKHNDIRWQIVKSLEKKLAVELNNEQIDVKDLVKKIEVRKIPQSETLSIGSKNLGVALFAPMGGIAGGFIGAIVGQLLIPIPGVGAIIGSAIFGVFGALIGAKVGYYLVPFLTKQIAKPFDRYDTEADYHAKRVGTRSAMFGTSLGGVLGTVLIPIPIVGTLVGMIAGAIFFGGVGAGIAKICQKLGEKYPRLQAKSNTVVTAVAAAGIGSGVGAVIGSFIFPGIGTFIGGVVGAILGGVAGAVAMSIKNARRKVISEVDMKKDAYDLISFGGGAGTANVLGGVLLSNLSMIPVVGPLIGGIDPTALIAIKSAAIAGLTVAGGAISTVIERSYVSKKIDSTPMTADLIDILDKRWDKDLTVDGTERRVTDALSAGSSAASSVLEVDQVSVDPTIGHEIGMFPGTVRFFIAMKLWFQDVFSSHKEHTADLPVVLPHQKKAAQSSDGNIKQSLVKPNRGSPDRHPISARSKSNQTTLDPTAKSLILPRTESSSQLFNSKKQRSSLILDQRLSKSRPPSILNTK